MSWKKLIEGKTLLYVSISIVVVACIARAIFSMRTGFLVPDEAYYMHALYGHCFNNRAFFTDILWGFTRFTGTGIFSLLGYGAFFGGIFSVGCIIVVWKTSKLITNDERVSGLTVLSFVLMPVFIIMTPTFCTEAPSLFFVLSGIYFILMFVTKEKIKYIFPAVVFLLFAIFVRQNYWMLLLGNAVIFGIVFAKNRKKVFFYSFLILLIFSILTTPPIAVYRFELPAWVRKMTITEYIPRILEESPIENITQQISSTSFYPDLPPLNEERGFTVTGFREFLFTFTFGIFSSQSPVIAILNFIGVALLAVSIHKDRNALTVFLVANVFLAYSTLAIHCFIFTMVKPVLYHLSTVFRFSHAVLFALPICLSTVYSYFNEKKRIISMISIFLCLGLMAPTMLNLVQSHFPEANRFSLDYKTPPLKVYEKFRDTKKQTLIFAESPRRVSLFIASISNVYSFPFVQEELFINLTKNWSGGVYVYGEIHPEHFEILIESRPFFLHLIRNETSYKVKTIWWDSESYFLEVMG